MTASIFHPTNKTCCSAITSRRLLEQGRCLGSVGAQLGFLPGFLGLVIGAVLAGACRISSSWLRRAGNGRHFLKIARVNWPGHRHGNGGGGAVYCGGVGRLGFAVVECASSQCLGHLHDAMKSPIGFIMGFYLQKFRPGQVAEVSLLGVVLLVAAVIFGRVVAQSSAAGWFEFERTTLVWALAGYGFLASVLPGWMLLVPRGYLSTFMKLGVVACWVWGNSHGVELEMQRFHDIRSEADDILPAVPLSLITLPRRVSASPAGLVWDYAEMIAQDPSHGGSWRCSGKFCGCNGLMRPRLIPVLSGINTISAR